MIFKLFQYVGRGVLRHRLRSALTLAGVASAMFLFCFIEGLQSGVRQATESSATDNLLIVYQRNRFCPAASSLPERYADHIRRMPGVEAVLPTKVYVNNCRASLDSVTFRGVPPEVFASGEKQVRLASGSFEQFGKRSDAALVGRQLAERRSLKLNDRFSIGGLSVLVVGTFESDIPGEGNVAYAPLEFIQRARGADSLGHVTQFEVRVKDAAQATAVARMIDEQFAADEAPTTTKPHKAYVAAATGDLLGLIRFTRGLGLLCVLVVLALTANTVYVMVQDRVKEHAVLQTLGFTPFLLFLMVIAEGFVLAMGGGIIGTGLAAAALGMGGLNLGAEGVNVSFLLTPAVVAAGLAASCVTGLLAALLPALQASTAPIADSLRRV